MTYSTMFARDVRASPQFAMIVVSLAMFTDLFIYGSTIPVLPFALTSRLKVPEDEVQKWNAVMLGTFGASMLLGSLIFGYLSDRIHSRRAPYLVGLLFEALGTALVSFTPNLPVTILSRGLQGLSCGIVYTVGYALVVDKVGSQCLGKVFGYLNLSMSLGWFMGPPIGGLLFDKLGYLAVFVPGMVLILIDGTLRLLMISNEGGPKICQEEPISPEPSIAGPSNQTLVDPVSDEIKAIPVTPHRHVILVLLTSPRVLVAALGQFVLIVGIGSMDTIFPVFMKDTFNFNSLHVALFMLILLVPLLIAPLFGSATDRFGAKVVGVFAFSLSTMAFILLRFVTEHTVREMVLFGAMLFVLGITFALANPAVAVEIVRSVEAISLKTPGVFGGHSPAAQAYSIGVAVQGIGLTVGSLGIGYFRIRFGWAAMSTFLGAVTFVELLLMLCITGGTLGIFSKLRWGRVSDMLFLMSGVRPDSQGGKAVIKE
ncbi:MFS general substrate transporter [Microthyrium microscopicum]|uniref:MFS general substrate transporter n=1 Tax=Microthyrium microscopicum TaxID=703497 RepID=A0A6A6U4R9_9PEZI|nr:MFS general substrate transporter [Microthyrium microscopicum]